MNGISIVVSPHSASLGSYWAAFLRDAIAAIAGAGFGAWLGARLAFRFERAKAAEDRQRAADAAARELANRRATAANLAIFSLSRMYNDALLYRTQILAPAEKTDAPWFWLMSVSVSADSYYHVNLDDLAFLLQSKQKNAPEMPMRLAIEEKRHRMVLDAMQFRAIFHKEYIVPIIERLDAMARGAGLPVLPGDSMRDAVGPMVFNTLRDNYSDIRTLNAQCIEKLPIIASELREVLLLELPEHVIIGFDEANGIGIGGSNLTRARREIAQRYAGGSPVVDKPKGP